MKEKVLIVEDEFLEADYLRMMLTKAGYRVTGIAYSVLEAEELIKQERPEIVLLDIFLKGKLTGIDLAKQLGLENIAFVYLSANSNEDVLNEAKATQPGGFLVKPFREKDLLVMLEIAQYRQEHIVESYFKRESHIKDKLSAIIASPDGWQTKLLNIGKTLQPYIRFDILAAGLDTMGEDPEKAISFLRIGYDEYQKIGVNELINITGLRLKELLAMAQSTSFNPTTSLHTKQRFEQMCLQPSLHALFSNAFQMRSVLTFPIRFSNGESLVFNFYSRKADTYTTDHIGLLSSLETAIAGGIDSGLSTGSAHKAAPLRIKDHAEVSKKSAGAPGFEGIIGKSHLLLDVFNLVTQVAPSDTSVLILGESGTGKERIADCIHNRSPRKDKPFVKVNCAALPSTLIESELFGHEKGSFTGALEKRIGKFEKADGGTIFLDEIGEMPLDLQVKLLRVLQEKYIERIGARDGTKINVRIIAATNRNLEKEVAEGRFRLDLYYRLNVFPIELPSLRERKEDIPVLAHYFIDHYNHKTGKKITGLSDKVLKSMADYSWPGNIRELENLMERSVLLAMGPVIEDLYLDKKMIRQEVGVSQDLRAKTISENERDYIVNILKKCNGRIWGSGGAAEILNLPPTTLRSKMKKLGIQKEY